MLTCHRYKKSVPISRMILFAMFPILLYLHYTDAIMTSLSPEFQSIKQIGCCHHYGYGVFMKPCCHYYESLSFEKCKLPLLGLHTIWYNHSC